jgi:glucose-1-phosphate thymidylyltransferase
MKGLILGGGLGTRLRPITHTGPKQLIPIANKPVLYYGIEDMKDAGIKDIGIIVGYTEERIKKIVDSIGDGFRWGVNIHYIEQDAPRGIAHAIGIAEDFIAGDDFVVHLGDNIFKEGIKKNIEYFKKSGAHACLILSESETPEKFGVAVTNEKGDVIEVEEKPIKPKTNLVITGLYFFKSDIFKFIKELKPSARGELEITHAVQKMIESKNHKVISRVIEGWWDDTGTAESVLRANRLILTDVKPLNKGIIEENVKIMGDVTIGEETVIKQGSVILGPVIIGKNCGIGPNSYIGPYTSIGDNTRIMGGEIESSIVIGGATIKFERKIVDSLIGKNAIILSENALPRGYRFVIGENAVIRT